MNHSFISYVTENTSKIARIEQFLTQRGISVWIDKNQLPAGVRWKVAIQRAIEEGGFFLACFSKEYYKRDQSYMNEELIFAIEQIRRRHIDRPWFIPIILDECDVPARSIGAGETLLDLQWVNLHLDWDAGLEKIADVILKDPFEAAKRELYTMARWIRKKEQCLGANDDLVVSYMDTYRKMRLAIREQFGKNYDPFHEM